MSTMDVWRWTGFILARDHRAHPTPAPTASDWLYAMFRAEATLKGKEYHKDNMEPSTVDDERKDEEYMALNGDEESGESRMDDEFSLYNVKVKRMCVWLSLSAFAIAIALTVPAIVEWQFRSDLIADVDLTTKEATYRDFTRNTQQPVLYSIYYFDVQNEDDVLKKGSKPIVVQRGPYSYDEHYEMFEIDFSHNKMRFFEQKYYIFNEEKSCVACNDTADIITTIDLVAIELLETLAGLQLSLTADEYELVEEALVTLLCETRGKVSPFTQKSIHSAHWGSWNDPTLLALEDLGSTKFINTTITATSYVPGFETNYTSRDMVKRLFGARDQVRSRGGKSMRYERYMGSSYVRACLNPNLPGNDATHTQDSCTPQDPEWDTMDEDSGEALANEYGWSLAYATREASIARGASPTFVKPLNLNRGNFGRGLFYDSSQRLAKFIRTAFDRKRRSYRGAQRLHLFIDSVYRELEFERTLEDGHISRRGVPLERYQLSRGDQLSAGPATYPWDQYDTPYGTLNLTRATGFPLLASQPHFYDSDPDLQADIIGLNPSRADHNTYFDIEPRSGEIFAAQERLQFIGQLFNYNLPGSGDGLTCIFGSHNDWSLFPDRINTTSKTKNNLGFLLPIGYIDQGYELTHSSTKELKQDLVDIDGFCDAFFIIFFAFALVAFSFFLYYLYELILAYYQASDSMNKKKQPELVFTPLRSLSENTEVPPTHENDE